MDTPRVEKYHALAYSGKKVPKYSLFHRVEIINFAGWNFAKITDVMVHRVHNGQALQDAKNTAELVFSNGCRNPSYRPLAPFNPWRDSR